MKYFEPYEVEIKKQIYISDIPDEHITEKTIMNHITKNDNFELLNPDNILINKRDRKKFDSLNTYHVKIDSSVWVILGKASDMNGDSIPRTYNLLLLGKLVDIDIDMEEINRNKHISEIFENYMLIKDDYNSILTYIFCVMDKNLKLYNDKYTDSHNAKCILDYFYKQNNDNKKINKRYKIIIYILIISLIALLFF